MNAATSLALGDLDRTVEHIVHAVEVATASTDPFDHLQLADTFPGDIYSAMLAAMPAKGDYRRMSGRARATTARDQEPTRTKIDLFPEYVRHLPPGKKAIWEHVGRALCSREVEAAFRHRLAPALERRFDTIHRSVNLFPVPILVRDVPGYRIGIHSDTPRKGITVQIYLPRDRSMEHVGTVFHRRVGDKRYELARRMPFAPNVGYAFVVANDTYHSADTVGPEVPTRDSILLTYFVDKSLAQVVHNRGKRVGNFLFNEIRSILR